MYLRTTTTRRNQDRDLECVVERIYYAAKTRSFLI
jgi:hypothetical protein